MGKPSRPRGGAGTPPGRWTEEMIVDLLANPIYAGVGPFPAIVSDDLWLKAFEHLVNDIGAVRACQAVRHALAGTFDPLPRCVEEWPGRGVSALEATSARAVGERLLTELRNEVGDPR
jgi:hypothetical protein